MDITQKMEAFYQYIGRELNKFEIQVCRLETYGKDGDRIIIIEDVITAGTAVREVFPILKSCGDISCEDMFISVNRCEVGNNFNKTAIDEVGEEFGINVHSIVSVKDIREYLEIQGGYEKYIKQMDNYIKNYCIL